MSANAQAARERHLAPAPILAGILLALTLLFLGRGLLLSPDRILAGSDTRILFVPWLATLRACVADRGRDAGACAAAGPELVGGDALRPDVCLQWVHHSAD